MEVGATINGMQSPLGESGLAIKTLSFVIASPESIVALQEVIMAQRTSNPDKQLMGDCDLSLADRVKAIEDTESEIAYLLFLKRCHTYQLFVDSSKDSRRTSDGFVIDTVQTVSKQAGSRRLLETIGRTPCRKSVSPLLSLQRPSLPWRRLYIGLESPAKRY